MLFNYLMLTFTFDSTLASAWKSSFTAEGNSYYKKTGISWDYHARYENMFIVLLY